MPWLKVDDNFPEHERIIGLPGPAAKWLHVVALCHCAKHLTDGHIEPFRLKVICAVAEVPRVAFQIKQLVQAGLWIDNGDGSFQLRDFLDYNPPAARVKAERESARQRMRSLRSSRERSGEQTPKFGGSSVTPSRTRSKEPVLYRAKDVQARAEESLRQASG